MKKLTTKEFVKKARAVHGRRYDYSRVVYVNAYTKIEIICRKHGSFFQIPNSHTSKRHGCDKCGGSFQLTTKEFVKKAKNVHGNRYDYSSVKYVGAYDQVQIICSIHGKFSQKASSHITGRGCRKCSYEQRATDRRAKDFFEKAVSVHGTMYDYSLVCYKNNRSHVIIICPVHGQFAQQPANHVAGKGCGKCGAARRGRAKVLAVKDFIEKAKAIHGEKYDYSKVVYHDSKSNVLIICKKHGKFEQKAGSHLQGKGCNQCGYETIEIKNKTRFTTEWFITESKKVHGDKYDYSRCVYENAKKTVEIICPIHGLFLMAPNSHTRQKQGCKFCGRDKNAASCRKTRDQFVKQAISKHGDLYDYSAVEYSNAHTNISIICKNHGVFMQSPNEHLKGCGCPVCYKTYHGSDAHRSFLREQRLLMTFDQFKNMLVDYGMLIVSYPEIWRGQNTGKLSLKCIAHSHEFEKTAGWLLNEMIDGCPECYPIKTKGMRERASHRDGKIGAMLLQTFGELHE